MDDLNIGLIDYEDFLSQLAKVSGLQGSKVEAVLEENKPNEALFEYISANLKPKYKIGILSNAGDDWISKMFKPEYVKLFDSIVLSFRAKVIKPDPEAYKLAANELKVEPTDCIFIDDREKYCEGARAVGMKAILYDNFPQIKKDLEEVLAAVSDN